MLGKALTTAAAGNAAGEGLYVEEVFSTYLYEGVSDGLTPQTLTNGIDLDGEGGLVWIKPRESGTYTSFGHVLMDTERGINKVLKSHATDAETTISDIASSFNSDGISLAGSGYVNENGVDYTSWTFRKAPKFFDVVTYTGTGSATTISHNLGSVPGCIMEKRTDSTGGWGVYHRGLDSASRFIFLDSDLGDQGGTSYWNATAPTDSVFSLGTNSNVNASGGTYVAYLFAHNDGDGEFGEDADQDIIKCGSIDLNSGSDTEVDLGFEPQWLMYKPSSTTGNWFMLDNMRGGTADSTDNYLMANSTSAEANANVGIKFTSTGFIKTNEGVNIDYIYIAIRRGPMKTPEDATEVFNIELDTGSPPTTLSAGSMPYIDAVWRGARNNLADNIFEARLTSKTLKPAETDAEGNSIWAWDEMDEITGGSESNTVNWMFRRAPGFFDVVAYTGNQTERDISHNLGVVPDMVIVKRRDSSEDWVVGGPAVNATSGSYPGFLFNGILNSSSFFGATGESDTGAVFRIPTDGHTDSTLKMGNNADVNLSGGDYIAYLFATLPGISKVGSYTGNGTSQTIDCGFTTGARFVLIKRTDSNGDWHVYDSERGIVAGNDPRLELNTNSAEDTGSDDIDPASSGFSVTSNADVNTNSAEYIFLAIA